MQNDSIIVLAWPEAMVAGANSWYDKYLSTKGKYRVGHAALILVNHAKEKLFYFDNGRYHTPAGFGRVRSQETDPDIRIKSKLILKNHEINNIEEILLEVKNKKACHGKGVLYASILHNISFEKAFLFSNQMVSKGLVPYGPFVRPGTNCSRFVSKAMRESTSSFFTNIRLKYPITITPSPKRNVTIANTDFFRVTKDSCRLIKRSSIVSYFKNLENEL
tara:strand:+ start:11701 stop:12357 length:657 start_codon:yes stop_codon:yes gene_type:complete